MPCLCQGVAGVAKGSKAAKKLPGLVMPLLAAKLASTFGMELRELKKGRPILCRLVIVCCICWVLVQQLGIDTFQLRIQLQPMC
jgi:hypothetical protein